MGFNRIGLAIALAAAVACAPAASAPAPPRPIWSGGSVAGDTLMSVREPGEAQAGARLLFTPQRMPALTAANGSASYLPGRDYVWQPGTRTIRLPAGSRIPSRTRDEMFVPLGPKTYGPSRSRPDSSLFLAEDHVFHDLQVDAAYPTRERWAGFTPKADAADLPRTLARLKAHRPVRLTVLGDSISTGASSSKTSKAPPYRPPYTEQVAAGLKALGAADVAVTNLSVGGKRSAWGVSEVPDVTASRPDLVILAFGMNDAIDVSPADYGRNMRAMVEQVLSANPQAEIVLVATMAGNADWSLLKPAAFPAFRAELLKLKGPHVAVADVTSLWAEVAARKDFDDLTGNGLNHPNDMGHRLYAEVILQLLR